MTECADRTCGACRLETRRQVIQDVNFERDSQDSKWGDQSGHDDLLWAAIHGEEYGEVCQAILSQKDSDVDDLYMELIQLASTCVAHAEALRVRGVR